MNNELTNLLPPERQKILSREYAIRFATVAALILAFLAVVATVLLLPSYVFLIQNETAKTSQLKNIESTISTSDQQGLSARLSALSANTATLIALQNVPSASTDIRSMLAIPRPGIIISGFVYTAPGEKELGTLVFSGIATTRDALRGYQLALQGAPFARSADLPVSAYAKDSNIAFTITVTLAP